MKRKVDVSIFIIIILCLEVGLLSVNNKNLRRNRLNIGLYEYDYVYYPNILVESIFDNELQYIFNTIDLREIVIFHIATNCGDCTSQVRRISQEFNHDIYRIIIILDDKEESLRLQYESFIDTIQVFTIVDEYPQIEVDKYPSAFVVTPLSRKIIQTHLGSISSLLNNLDKSLEGSNH